MLREDRCPHEGCVENFRTHTGLVRKLLRSERLVTEMTTVGRLGKAFLRQRHGRGHPLRCPPADQHLHRPQA
ncbi:MAG TPA: hypothetical protein DCM14_08375 [Clostridiales bacterium UBA8153]|nr:hypothetical protein [Clostridiales bacterium UBA8153]